MKRFIILAFFIVDANSEAHALELANETKRIRENIFLMFDEEQPVKEILIDNENELPHTFPYTSLDK